MELAEDLTLGEDLTPIPAGGAAVHPVRVDSRFGHADRVLSQRDIRLIDFGSIGETVVHPDCPIEPDETAMLLARGGNMFDLNLAAALIWEGIDGERSVSDIAVLVCHAFGIGFDRALEDTAETLVRLQSLGLIAIRDDALARL